MSNDRSRAYKCNDSDTTIVELRQQLNDTQNCAEAQIKELKREREFREAFELWYKDYKRRLIDDKTGRYAAAVHMSWITAMRTIDKQWDELKAQHLTDQEKEA